MEIQSEWKNRQKLRGKLGTVFPPEHTFYTLISTNIVKRNRTVT